MTRNPDVVIVGGGVIGASIAFHLASIGVRRVVLCEQGLLPGMGATPKSRGIIRMHHTNPWQARLAWQSYSTYANWADVVGGDCGFRTSGFACVVGPEHIDHLHHNVRMLRRTGVPVMVLSPDDFVDLQPFCSPQGIGAVAYEPFSGYASPSQATLGFLNRAQQDGVNVIEGAQVTELITHNNNVTGVRTNFGEISAGTVVLAANFWAVHLLKDYGVELPVQPERIGICAVSWLAPSDAPPLCTYLDDTVGTYFRPAPGQRLLIGIGATHHERGAELPLALQADEMQAARDRVHYRLPLLETAEAVGSHTGFDGYTPDKHAIIGQLPNLSGVYLAIGFSGGGFKVAPAVGQAIATELTSSAVAPELEGFRLERFAADRLIRADYPYTHM